MRKRSAHGVAVAVLAVVAILAVLAVLAAVAVLTAAVVLASAAKTGTAHSRGRHPQGAPAFTTVYPINLRLTGDVRNDLTEAEQICWTKKPYVTGDDIRFNITRWAGGRPDLKLDVARVNGVVSASLVHDQRTFVSAGPAGIGIDRAKRRVTIDTDLRTRRTAPGAIEQVYTVHVAGAFGCRQADPR